MLRMCQLKDPGPWQWVTSALVLAAIVAAAAMRVVAVTDLSSLLLPRLQSFKVSHASRLLPRPTCIRAEVAFSPSRASWWKDVALL
jgi:hypothetical protein